MQRHTALCSTFLSTLVVTGLLALMPGCGGSPSRDGFEAPPSPGLSGSSNGAAPGELQACATATLESRVRTVDLVIMLDRSSSMMEKVGTQTRWAAATAAMSSFLASAPPSSMKATLSFFGAGVKRVEVCDPSSYLVPRVPLTELPDTTRFASVFDTTFPFGSTPTAAALSGALLQAQAISARSDDRPAIVFVTDGLPEGCEDKDDLAYSTAVAAEAKAAGVPAFIVGVGPKLTNLEALAVAAGTKKAFLIDEAAPGDLTTALTAALSEIRDEAGTCAVDVPSPPANDVLDPERVNVSFAGGAVVARDEACRDGAGWHYAGPSAGGSSSGGDGRIVLCPGTCEEVKGGKPVTLTFGCATVVR